MAISIEDLGKKDATFYVLVQTLKDNKKVYSHVAEFTVISIINDFQGGKVNILLEGLEKMKIKRTKVLEGSFNTKEEAEEELKRLNQQ